ncbi:MAG: hypothetical protein JSR77_03850 [Planctomycetes bacterium]|nr:hypothetical protein [Planctomycetota bacterium]
MTPGHSRAEPFGIAHLQHRFAAWAASRAASVNGCRFKVELGREILEQSGFGAAFNSPSQLPEPHRVDAEHRRWRSRVVNAAAARGLNFTHGVAAKLLNVYLKSRFVCGGCHSNPRVKALHPPIDDVLLKTLADLDVGGQAPQWRQARRIRWSKFNSEQYEQLINRIRTAIPTQPLWMIEEHWKGHQ